MNVVVDLDQTLFPLLESMQALPGGERVRTDCPHWDSLSDLCDRPLSEMIEAAIDTEHALDFGLYSGARETLQLWKDAGTEVVIATHRHSRYKTVTENFLKATGLLFPLFIGEEIDKTALLREGGILIDDAPHVLKQAYRGGFRSATLLHSYNREIVDLYEIPAEPDWYELARRLDLP